jgi:hypothetical protein
MLLKISLGIFFLRLTFSRVPHVIIYVAVTTSLIFSVAMFFFAVFQCGYYKTVGEFILRRLTNKCASDSTARGISYTHATMTILTDWTFILLPVFIVWGTLKTRRQKVTFGLFMCFVALSGIAAIARVPYIETLAIPKRGFLGTIAGIVFKSSASFSSGSVMLTVFSAYQASCRLVCH